MPTTLTAKQLITESLETGSIDYPSHAAWGSASASFDESDTTLGSEILRNAVGSTDRQNTTIEWTGTVTTTQANGETIQEVGLFNDASAGDMFIREVVFPVNKTSSFEYDTIFVMRIK